MTSAIMSRSVDLPQPDGPMSATSCDDSKYPLVGSRMTFVSVGGLDRSARGVDGRRPSVSAGTCGCLRRVVSARRLRACPAPRRRRDPRRILTGGRLDRKREVLEREVARFVAELGARLERREVVASELFRVLLERFPEQIVNLLLRARRLAAPRARRVAHERRPAKAPTRSRPYERRLR